MHFYDGISVMAFLAFLSCTAINLAFLLASHAFVFFPAFLHFHVISLIASLAVLACTAIFLDFIALIATPISILAFLILIAFVFLHFSQSKTFLVHPIEIFFGRIVFGAAEVQICTRLQEGVAIRVFLEENQFQN